MTTAAARARLTGSESRSMPFVGLELREAPDGTGGSKLSFRGYASVTEAPYEIEDWLGTYTETIHRGAFTKTLLDGADVSFLINHAGVTLARTKSGTLRLAEDATGLLAEADLDPVVPEVQTLRSGIERGDLDEMSFAFRVTRQEWNADYDVRDIHEVSLNKGDVSVVNYGANPHTSGLVSMRGLDRVLERASVEELHSYVARACAQIRAAGGEVSTEQIAAWLGQVAVIDQIVDALQEDMAEAAGVDNPDTEDMTEGELMQASTARWRQIQRRARLVA